MYNTIDSTIINTMNNIITANELKTKGVSALDSLMKNDGEVVVTVRGKNKYVILKSSEFDRLRECELTTALLETEADLKSGKYRIESAEEHLKRIGNA